MIIWRKKHMELTKETCRQTAEELLHFLEKSPSSFHAIANITNMLEAAGFEEIREEENWKLLTGRLLLCDPQSVFCHCI